MLMMTDIEKISGFAIGRKAVIAIYVFGSAATGKDRSGSDIDLAVMVAGAFSGMARVEMETTLMVDKELLDIANHFVSFYQFSGVMPATRSSSEKGGAAGLMITHPFCTRISTGDYITKPFHLEDVRIKVDRILSIKEDA